MREAIRFIFTYSIVSVLILMLWQVIFHPLSAEIFSYTIWLYIFYAIVGVAVFSLFGLLSKSYRLSFKVKVICYAILCLFVLNSIPLFGEKKFITVDLIRGVLVQRAAPIDIGIHLVAVASFIISAQIAVRKNKAVRA